MLSICVAEPVYVCVCRYMDGGVKSGFNHVDTTFKKRLMQIKGKHHVRVLEVTVTALCCYGLS